MAEVCTQGIDTGFVALGFAKVALLGVVVMLPPSLAQSASPGQKSWESELTAWRQERAAELQAPEGWLSLIGLGWLQEGENSFGSGADNRIQINAKTPAHLGVVRLEKGKVRLVPAPGGFPKRVWRIAISARSGC
jgi:hypothetical protein